MNPLTNKVITVLLKSNMSRRACSRNPIKSRSSCLQIRELVLLNFYQTNNKRDTLSMYDQIVEQKQIKWSPFHFSQASLSMTNWRFPKKVSIFRCNPNMLKISTTKGHVGSFLNNTKNSRVNLLLFLVSFMMYPLFTPTTNFL